MTELSQDGDGRRMLANDLKREEIKRDPNRLGWANRVEFLLSCIGYAVGLGNVWRFPWLVQKNGGGAFLIPYFIMLLLEGIPVFYLELSIGQRMKVGPLQLWKKVSGYAKGIGVAMIVGGSVGNTGFMMVLAWCLYYLGASFQSPLPWATCPRESYFNMAMNRTSEREVEACSKIGVTQYYWYYETLQISSGMTDFGGFNWRLELCLIGVWIIVILALLKGIRSSGKVAYFLVIFPYITLSIFFVRGFFLEGYQDGLSHLFTPKWHRLADFKVWVDAAAQIFYSLSIGYGGLLTFGSYNPTHQDSLIDTMVIVTANSLTSIFAGITIFSMLGYRANYLSKDCLTRNIAMATQMDVVANQSNATTLMNVSRDMESLKEYAHQQHLNLTFDDCSVDHFLEEGSGGTGLAFIALTEAISQLPASTFFSFIFFLMLLSMGLSSVVGGIESVATSIKDTQMFRNIHRGVIVVIIALVSSTGSLIYATYAGEYYIQLVNAYGTDLPTLILVLFELIAISHFYGINKFCDDIKFMTGRETSIIWKVLWVGVCPLLIATLLVIFLIGTITSNAVYEAWDRKLVKLVNIPYPRGALAVASCLSVVVGMIVPFFALHEYIQRRKRNHKLIDATETELTTLNSHNVIYK